MQEKEQQEYSFINEKIKEKPISKKWITFRVLFVLAMAVLFGVVAALVFTLVQPKIEQQMNPKEDTSITFPKDEEETETEVATEIETEDTETETEETEIEEIVDETQKVEMELEDYQDIQNKMYAVGRTANKFIVTVTGVKSDTDWFNNAYESKGQASGIIIGNNGNELLILTERKAIADAKNIFVTFIDDSVVGATIKKYDGNTGITVLSVALSDIAESTMESIEIATLGNSYGVKQGTVVIAVGSPLGSNYSILTGNVTSTTNSISTTDNTYSIFTTDIVGSVNGSGALINLSGEIVGLVMQDYSSSEDESTLTAVSISELKSMIEMLSNGKDIPYIGLQIVTVTNTIAEEYDIPKGVYIKDVVMDSPAMAAGLQSGDILVEMNGESIISAEMYESALLALEPESTVEIIVNRQGIDGYHEVTYNVEVSVLQ